MKKVSEMRKVLSDLMRLREGLQEDIVTISQIEALANDKLSNIFDDEDIRDLNLFLSNNLISLKEELAVSLSVTSNVLKDIEGEHDSVFSKLGVGNHVKKDKIMLTKQETVKALTELTKELDGKLIKSNGNTVLFVANRDDFLLEPQTFLDEKGLFDYTNRKEFESMNWHTDDLEGVLSLTVDELKEESKNTIKIFYEKVIPEHFEKQLNEKPEDMVFLVNIEPAFVIDKFHENSAQLAHLRYYSFAKEKS